MPKNNDVDRKNVPSWQSSLRMVKRSCIPLISVLQGATMMGTRCSPTIAGRHMCLAKQPVRISR